jgi:hypothetical protein
LLLFTFLAQLQWNSISTYNHLHLKRLQIVREMMYYLKNDKTELTPFCFLGPDTILHLFLFSEGSKVTSEALGKQ